jgi:hypothetical protein
MLPLWVQWAQAILILVISGLGAWIAYKQVQIATAKLNLDLYDKRFEVFEAARNLVVHVLQEGRVDLHEINRFNVGVLDAVFLFEEDVVSYLEHLRKRAIALRTKTEQLRVLGERDPRRDALIDGIADLEGKFADEYARLVNAFKRDLKLGNI